MKRQSCNQPLKQLLVLLCAIAMLSPSLATISRAQEPTPSPAPTIPGPDKAELHQALIDLTNPWTVMCVAAHPDDEDGATLIVLRRKYGVHTVSLFSTYGEGGQNAVGPELYEQLGVIRARETMNAARIQGSEPYFLGLKDFGFSKSADEAFRVWGHDEALRRMVLKIRELRPDVIITNHDTTSGHGHHQATGRLILEAFDAAADPKRFPEQLTELKPWQVQRLFVRIFGGGSQDNKTASPEKTVSVDPNEVDPVRGTSFAAQSLAALQQHATQGPWPKSIEAWLRARRIENGRLPAIRYQLVREAPNAQPLPNIATTVLDGLKPPASISASLVLPMVESTPLTDFLGQPDRVLDTLLKWKRSASDLRISSEDSHRVRLLEARFNNAIAIASGITLAVNSRNSILVPGQTTTFSINLANSGNRTVAVKNLSFSAWGEPTHIDPAELLLPDTETTVTIDKTTPLSAKVTVPKEDHLYDDSFSGQSFRAEAELMVEGAKFLVSSRENVDVAPAVEINNVSPSPCVRTPEAPGHCNVLEVALTNHLATPFRGTMTIDESDGKASPTHLITHQLVLGPNEARTETLRQSNSTASGGTVGKTKLSGSLVISIYRSGASNPITQHAVPLVFSNARVVSDLKVGYVPSFDETLQSSLAALGVEAKSLNAADLQTADLSNYKTIIIDNRGYEAHPELLAANSHLLDFVQQGGTLIVFYHKDNEWNPDVRKNRPALAPYPLLLGGERVTDEKAPIRFLAPRHPLMNYPNRIQQTDFENWIQERGLYYPKEWDAHFTALFSTRDPGEEPLQGGLLVAQYGRGNYIYTSMVWYRQLRAGVPGAYRMLANMISYGHR